MYLLCVAYGGVWADEDVSLECGSKANYKYVFSGYCLLSRAWCLAAAVLCVSVLYVLLWIREVCMTVPSLCFSGKMRLLR